ncbi:MULTISPECIES: carboxypeptidase regulatory-like domain-containing protein [unclassified Tenacibaculum]|uniref:carboxypeptidase regulatory-like domain-containing protein n=1 Tax=unclassified Tenacibaculum TaxID=2635139 RepID=UPI001F4921AF|nr:MULTISPECIES: carboxypeptidase regulatory-like domain-containing protein [unclassified Tenacibaculum]MCF2873390.1 carboxypeptidase regulatory-like domain-containing protein [Tenacibaculum sp. Cn5-1]MCF2933546.1 carboxypeptidase regulatory-like domain-containing protein [Tenacibaculum sp. Cn5-34]MCG7509872.1 carboxypeptidase regulatory-like domain-containing protein [Tenacibaculum sp. Cn5-46]
MRKVIKIISLLLTTLVFVQCGEDGTIGLIEYGDLTGKVVKKDGFVPLENVKITLSPTNNTTFTDAEGNFKFERIEVQEYSVQATKEGYLDKFEGATVTVEAVVNVVLELEISTALNKPPTKPELLTPADGTEDLPNEVELTWESTDPEEDELTYVLELRNDFNNDVTRIADIKEKKYLLSNLKYGGKYFWSIEVTDGINAEVVSSIRSFTVKEDPGNRYFYVKNEGGNNVIYSSSFNETNNEVSNTVQLTDPNLNSWRPRKSNVANLIAFLRIDNNEAHIYTMKTNGNDVQKVTSTIPVAGFNLNEMDFSWSPDGSKLLYSNFGKLYSINKDGSGLQNIYETTGGSLITECDWSSDGTKIAIKTNNANGYDGAILVIDMDGNVLSTVISGVVGAMGGINLSASGNKLLFTRDISNHQATNYRQLDTRLFIYDFTDMSFTDISNVEKTSGTNDLDPRFSPNEAEVIFVNTSNDGISQRNIMRTNLVGNIERRMVFTNAIMPDWE